MGNPRVVSTVQMELAYLLAPHTLDEAERCKDVFVPNKGLLATGTPHELTQMSEERCFQVKIPKSLEHEMYRPH